MIQPTKKTLTVNYLIRGGRPHQPFDDENLVSCAGPVLMMALAEQAGLSELI